MKSLFKLLGEQNFFDETRISIRGEKITLYGNWRWVVYNFSQKELQKKIFLYIL
jgi:hypothetical protein